MKIILDIEKEKLHFVDVPEIYKKFRIINYGYAGTYIMENENTGLNHWKMKIPNGKYEILGFVKDIIVDDVEIDKNFILLKK